MTSTADRIAELDAIARRPDPNCDIYIAIRHLLIDPTQTIDDFSTLTDPTAIDLFDIIRDHILAIDEHCDLPHQSDSIQSRSMLLLEYSLCPMHRIDYAICFDDDDPDCAQIRALFPSHDT